VVGVVSGLDVRPLGGRLGAQVLGAGPLADLGRGALDDLRTALLRHKVLALRDQHLGAAEHHAFLARFAGGATPSAPAATAPAWDAADGEPLGRWVCPDSFRLAPPRTVSLRTTGPDVAGECSIFADLTGAYRDLPRPLRVMADSSWAVHGEHPGDERAATAAVHPVTRLHTETGDRGLLLGAHARSLIGPGAARSRTVLPLLRSYLTRPHNLLRWDWREGDVLLVDARAVQHRVRAGRRPGPDTTAALQTPGDPPLGVDGRHSHHLGRRAALSA